ncbi:MAG TPA: hypothetical protein VF516_40155 [Kofleriaceae bacterium]
MPGCPDRRSPRWWRRSPRSRSSLRCCDFRAVEVAQQIALAHGGDIDVASSSAAGTTVTIRLPRNAEAAEATAESTSRSHSHGAVSGPRAPA